MRKVFIQPCEKESDAWELCAEFAQQLRAQGLTPSHRVGVEPVRTGRKETTWYVVLTIDESEEAQ